MKHSISGYQESRKAVLSGKTTCVEQTKHFIEEIGRRKSLNCFLEVFEKDALMAAEKADRAFASGKAGRLAGMVVALKDNICFKGHKVSASSKILQGFESLFSSPVVEKMLAEGAIILGRTNCDEFAMGSSNENSAFGPVHNPINEACTPGGSSGGSAAAVAAGLCHVALGSDTGGSIRQPASFCGVVGMKGTYGRVTRNGLIAYASSFDQIGPLAKNVEDAALVMEIISGKDPGDSTSSSMPVDAYSQLDSSFKPKKIAVISDCLNHPSLDPQIRDEIRSTMIKLESSGHVVREVSFPFIDFLVPAYYVLTTAEASSNLARYSGVGYGFRPDSVKDVESTYVQSRTLGFGPEVKRRIMLGTFVLSAGFYDAYYGNGQKVRRMILEKTLEILSDNDFILLPSTPKTAFKLGEISDPVTLYLEDIFTVQANLAGLPAISLPLYKHTNGLPFGLQLMGREFGEKALFDFSAYLSQLS